MPFISQYDFEICTSYRPYKVSQSRVCTAGNHQSPKWPLGATSRASLTTQQDFIRTALVIARHKFQLLSLTEEELAGQAESNSKQVCNKFAFIAEKNNDQVLKTPDDTSSLLLNSTSWMIKPSGLSRKRNHNLELLPTRWLLQELCLGKVQSQFNTGL